VSAYRLGDGTGAHAKLFRKVSKTTWPLWLSVQVTCLGTPTDNAGVSYLGIWALLQCAQGVITCNIHPTQSTVLHQISNLFCC
jgi:hypothetical protein